MLYTNEKRYGGSFYDEFVSKLKTATDVEIATGYIGASLVDDLTPRLLQVAKRGSCKMLIGMIYHGGITTKQKQTILHLDNELRNINQNNGNGVYISRREYHGKIYRLDDYTYLGSSNFSKQGFKTRWEGTAQIKDTATQQASIDYLNFLFSQKTTEKLSDVQLRIKGGQTVRKPSKLLKDYRVASFPSGKIICEMEIKLRVDDQPKSSLNLFFEAGRKNKDGRYEPRPWYEVEITTEKKDREHPCYPKSKLKPGSANSRQGEFDAYIQEDGKYYKLNMVISSSYGKAIQTSKKSGGRETLGRYIKGKLESAGLIKIGERITSDTLDAYGRDYIKLKKLDEKTYILEF